MAVETPIEIDGLCIVGTLVSVEPVNRSDGSGIVEGFMKALVQSSRGEMKLDLSKVAKEMQGDVPLPAFDKLRIGAVGKKWAISVGTTKSEFNGKTYFNYVAVDASPL